MQHFLYKCCIFLYTYYIGTSLFSLTPKIKKFFAAVSFLISGLRFFLCMTRKIDSAKNGIFLILINSKIALCHAVRRMIVDIHQKRRRRSLFPRVVAERFAQRMAADVLLLQGMLRSFFYDAVCLCAAQRRIRGSCL